MQLSLIVIVLVSTAFVDCKLNLLENPSFEKSDAWDLWERTSMWKVQPATDSVRISKDNPHKGLGSLLLSSPRDLDLQAVIASQYVNLQNSSHVGPTSLTLSFQAAGEELKHLRAVLAISFADGHHMLADLPAKDYAINNEDDDDDFTEVCGYIPAHGQIRALMLHLIVDREARSTLHVDSVRLLPNQPPGKACLPYVTSFPPTHHTLVNFLTPEDQLEGPGITLATQLTIDRWSQLEVIAERWQGPISAAVLIFQKEARSNVQDLTTLYYKSSVLQEYVSVHLVFEDVLNGKDHVEYPANFLRNIALSNTLTSHVFFIDADITPMFSEAATFESINRALSMVGIQSEETKLAFIAPLFHSTQHDETVFPETKEELLLALKSSSSLEQMDVASHSAVKYTKWKVNARAYEIPYVQNMEPYFIVSSDSPLLNDMFVGYGRDKCAYSKELNKAGYHFVVLPDIYIINRRESSQTATILNRSRKGASLVDLQVFLNTAFHEKDMEHGYFNYPRRNALSVQQHSRSLKPLNEPQYCSSKDGVGVLCTGNDQLEENPNWKYENPAEKNKSDPNSPETIEQHEEMILESDGGLGCNKILLNEDIFSDSKLPLHPKAQSEVSTILEYLSKTYGTWTLVHIPGLMKTILHHMVILYHPDAIISITLNYHHDDQVVNGINHDYYFTKSTVFQALGNVAEDYPENAFLFYLKANDLEDSDSSRYLAETIQRATDKDLIMLERKSAPLVAIHKQMCEAHPSWKMYTNGNFVLLKSRHLTEAPPVVIPAPPSIASLSEVPSCPPGRTKTDIFLMTKNRPLQTLAFLESLQKLVKYVNKVWIIQRTDEQAFRDGYEKVVKCMGKLLEIEVLEQQGVAPIGGVVLEALEKSKADYAMFAVDELVWTHPVDLNEVGCLLENSGEPTTSFQLRLGDNLNIPLNKQQKEEQFITLKANQKICMYYPLRLQYDYAYAMHLDAMVMKLDVIIDDLKDALPIRTTPGSIETTWLKTQLHSRCRQWHFMYKQSSLVNNMGHIDGRVAGAGKPSKGSFQLLDILMKDSQKIDVDQFLKENQNQIRYTHSKILVTYKDWVC